jgi:hypothetical protein
MTKIFSDADCEIVVKGWGKEIILNKPLKNYKKYKK